MKFFEKINIQVTRYIKEHALMDKSGAILCAVSGGADSMVMVHILKSIGYRIGIAHCNFKLREKDADKDEAFVMTYAETHQLPFFNTSFDTSDYAKKNKVSIQMAARNLRYEWLEKIRKENNFHAIATAHHVDDNMETVLLNFTKGTGLNGLKGIQPKNEKIVRPLLCLTKGEILKYAEKSSVNYRTDKSNAESKYERNKIRNKVIPLLQTINPSLPETFQKNTEHLNDSYEIFQYGLNFLRKKLIETRNGNIYISINKLRILPGWKTILDSILSQYNFSHGQVTEAIKISDTASGKQIINADYRLIKDRNFFIIVINNDKENGNPVLLIESPKHKIRTKDFSLKFEVKNFKGVQNKSAEWFMQFDASKIAFPLMVRKWKAGDYFYPLGMNKKKKVSDFLVNEKVSILEKEKIFVLISDEKIICVLGRRIDERFKVTEKTTKALGLKLKVI
jgi:tRNA(Ile)-lysidine synthase